MSRTLPDGLELPDADDPEEACSAIPRLEAPEPAGRGLLVLATGAFVLRLAALLLDPVPPRDSIALARAVTALAGGDPSGLTAAVHHPLGLLLAAPAVAAGVDPLTALAILAALAGALAVLPLHALTRHLVDGPTGTDAANAACLLFAVTPPIVRLGSTALLEPFLHLFVLLSLLFAARAFRHFRPARDAAFAGLAAGAAFLARPEGLALLPVAAFVGLPSHGGRPARQRALAGLLAVAGFAVLAGPWLGAVAAERGEWRLLPTKRAAVLTGSLAPAAQGGATPTEDHAFGGAVLQAVGALPEALHPGVTPFVVLGLVAVFVRGGCGRKLGTAALVAAVAGLFTGGVVVLEWRYGYGGRRHASTAAVVLLPFAGAGFLAAGTLLRRVGGAVARPVVAHGILVFGVALPLAAGALLQRDRSGAEARALGAALRPRIAAGARIGTFGEPRIAWYAGGLDVRLLRDFGIPPGADETVARERSAALDRILRSRGAPDIVVFEAGDRRQPPGWPPAGAPAPLAEAGRLRAWRTADLLP